MSSACSAKISMAISLRAPRALLLVLADMKSAQENLVGLTLVALLLGADECVRPYMSYSRLVRKPEA